METRDILLSVGERNVLLASSEVKFGELFDVTISPGNEERFQVSGDQEKFIESLRRERDTLFHLVLVHNGVPVQAEVVGEICGIKYRKKIRFS